MRERSRVAVARAWSAPKVHSCQSARSRTAPDARSSCSSTAPLAELVAILVTRAVPLPATAIDIGRPRLDPVGRAMRRSSRPAARSTTEMSWLAALAT